MGVPFRPMPRTEDTFRAGAGPSLEYDFFNFNSFQGSNDSINANSDAQPLAYSIQVDSQAPITVIPVGLEVPCGLPDGWYGLDGWVANSIITVSTTFKGVSRGNHTLKISMMQPALVIQKIVIDTSGSGLRSSYLGPPESIFV